MGNYLSSPNKHKNTDRGTIPKNSKSLALYWGSCEMQGWRVTMEDAHIIYPTGSQTDEVSFFAVLDGHGGKEVAIFVKNHFVQELLKNQKFKQKNYRQALTETCYRMDELLKTKEGIDEVKKIREDSMPAKDEADEDATPKEEGEEQKQESQPESQPGCTANMVLIAQDTIYCANVGDSRSVMCRGNQPVPLSEDHKPGNESELKRITKAGGFVTENRINGSINLSRAIGDLEYKKDEKLSQEEQLIIATPDIKEFKITKDDKWILMGCDGIWECKKNEEYVQMINDELGKIPAAKNKQFDPQNLCLILENLMEQIIAPSAGGHGCDNMTAILIKINNN